LAMSINPNIGADIRFDWNHISEAAFLNKPVLTAFSSRALRERYC
jgi:hypothetical protein